MPRTKNKPLVVVQKSLPYLYIGIPDLKKSGPLYVGKANPPPLPKAAMKPAAKPPKPPAAAMAPKPSMQGLNARGRAALDAVPLKSITSKEDDEGDE